LQAGSAIPGFLVLPVWFDVNSSLPEGFHIAGPLRIFRFSDHNNSALITLRLSACRRLPSLTTAAATRAQSLLFALAAGVY
jgi:hypothetical protein